MKLQVIFSILLGPITFLIILHNRFLSFKHFRFSLVWRKTYRENRILK